VFILVTDNGGVQCVSRRVGRYCVKRLIRPPIIIEIIDKIVEEERKIAKYLLKQKGEKK
jgi:hypothetical protein